MPQLQESFGQSLHLVWVGQGNPVTRHQAAGNSNPQTLYPCVYSIFDFFYALKWAVVFWLQWQYFDFPLLSGKPFPNTALGAAATWAFSVVFVLVPCCLCLSFLVCSAGQKGVLHTVNT